MNRNTFSTSYARTNICLSMCNWPGRTQTISKEHVTYYLDGAHTLESIQVCAAWFNDAADKEKQLLCDDVARILIFNSTKGRDVGSFFQILKNCGFDAAVICTNITSTNGAFIRADQMNRTVAPKTMELWAESSKAVWDSLPSACQSHPIMDAAVDESMLRENVDHNFNSKVKVPVRKVNSPACDCQKGCDESMLHQPNGSYELCNSLDKSISSNMCSLGNAGDATSVIDKSRERHGQAGETKQQPSYFFQSILEALAWAARGRDPIIGESIVSDSLPDVDPGIKEKRHVQVLITGSLHLVGGVLGIIAPDLND